MLPCTLVAHSIAAGAERTFCVWALATPHSARTLWLTRPVECYVSHRSASVASVASVTTQCCLMPQEITEWLCTRPKSLVKLTIGCSQYAPQPLFLSMVRMCLQVFDMLMAADVPYSSSLLGNLFNVSQLSDECFDLLQLDINLGETDGISYLVLADCLRRASSSIPQGNPAAPTRFSTAKRPTEKTLFQCTHLT